MRRTGFLVASLVLSVLLAGCGNKGDLVKPGTEPAPAKKAAPATAPKQEPRTP
jgi:predicted small lipoprotein YifL